MLKLRKLHQAPRLIFLSALLTSQQVRAEVDLLLFPQIIANHEQGSEYTMDDVSPSLDIYTHGNWENIRFIGEYFWSETEHHFERFQLGYSFSENTEVSIGRFHTPYGYWHTEYHHGSYLQPTIRRPAVEEFGVDGGIIPSHMLGALFEHSLRSGSSSFEVSFAVGLGPEIETEEAGHGGGHGGADGGPVLHDADLFDFKRANHESMYVAKLVYRPDEFGIDQLGVHLISADIKIDSHDHQLIEFGTLGLFATTELGSNKLISSIYYVETEFKDGEHEDEYGNFVSGYIQLEHSYTDQVLLYGRIEDSAGDRHDLYLETLSSFVPERQAAGIRYDFYSDQALKLEFLNNVNEDETDKIFLVEWSAVFR